MTGSCEITQAERAWWQRRAAAGLASILAARRGLPCISWTVGPAGPVLAGRVNGLAPAAQVRAASGAWQSALVLEDYREHQMSGGTTWLHAAARRHQVKVRLTATVFDDVRPAGLLAKLMTAVRPGFRGDVLVFDPRDPVFGGPPCTIVGCGRPQRERGMCRSHRRRWVQAGRPDPAEFAATTSTDWRGHLPVPSCQVAGCHYGGDGGHGLCRRHARQWQRAGCPRPAAWRGSQPPPATQPPACRVGYCDLRVRGTSTLCRTHRNRWTEQGRPDLEDFITSRDDPGPGAGERAGLRCLAPHLRLEVQYALQCRHDEQKARIFPAQLQPILRGLAAQQVSSMLDKPGHTWPTCTPRRAAENAMPSTSPRWAAS